MTALRALSLVPRRLLSLPSSARPSPSFHRDDARRVLAATWDAGSRSLHPFTWLRDACPCPACAHPTTLNRRTTLRQLDLNCTPRNVTSNDAAAELSVEWTDGHTSVYRYGWLRERCFVNPKKEEVFPVRTWGRGHQAQRFEWRELVQEDAALCNFLLALKTEGVCFVKNAPSNNDGLEKLVGAIGHPWSNHYAHYFDILIKNDPSNVGYTSDALSPHIDLPYYFEPPGVQFLHCIARTPDVEGGQNQLVDGFFVAEVLRREDPEVFQLLCETPIHFLDYGTDFVKDFHLELWQRIIQFDGEGRLSRITFSNYSRTSRPCVPLEKVELFYRAIKKFEDLLYRESFEHDPREGDVVVVNNHRVLHGRSAFRVRDNGQRYIRGTYMTWDILNSRHRRLQAKLAGTQAL